MNTKILGFVQVKNKEYNSNYCFAEIYFVDLFNKQFYTLL